MPLLYIISLCLRKMYVKRTHQDRNTASSIPVAKDAIGMEEAMYSSLMGSYWLCVTVGSDLTEYPVFSGSLDGCQHFQHMIRHFL